MSATNGTEEPGPEDDATSPWPERLLVATSTAFTVFLFVYLVWQGTTAGPATPTATVVGTEPLPNGQVQIAVELHNPKDVGLLASTVTVDCETPPPELTFEHVPADDRRTGYVICPPGTERPSATVSTWTEA